MKQLTILMLICLNLNLQGQSQIGDNGPAIKAVLESPSGLAIDSKGNLYIAERRGNRIRMVDAKTGMITTIVGTGENGFGGDGGPATMAMISNPELISVDSQDNLIITDRSNGRIRKIDSKTSAITTIAGSGEIGYAGDGGPAIEAKISYPFGVLVGPDDDIFIADTENHAIRKVDHMTGIITTVAGNGQADFKGDGGLATQASLNRPHNMTFDNAGNLIIGDSENQRIRRVDQYTGKIKTLYGRGEMGFTVDGKKATEAKFGYFGNMTFYKGNLVFSGWVNKGVRIVDTSTNLLSSVKNRNGEPVEINGPYGIAIYESSLYVAEVSKNRVLKIDLENGSVEVFAGK